jgi:hypothetical protein
MKNIFFTCLALAAALVSCTKEIDIQVKDADTRYVVEANLNQNAGSATVKISKSTVLSDTTDFPYVSNALVVISHNGQNDTLTETANGFYTHPTLAAITGQTYSLSITVDANKIFTSSAIMPPPAVFDSIRQENLTTDTIGGRVQTPDEDGNVFVILTPVYTDDAAFVNFYQFMLYKNNELQDAITVYDDEVTNGQTNGRPVFLGAKAGDTIIINMQCLDNPAYDYFFALEETISQSSAAPANPKSNLTGGALGYFKLHSLHPQHIIIR